MLSVIIFAVGHCHPCVVRAGSQQMGKLSAAYGFLMDTQSQYAAKLIETLPEPLSVLYFTNSGSEANDLALRLARQFTNANDVVVVDGSFHGNLQVLTNLSPKYLKQNNVQKPDWVHVVSYIETKTKLIGGDIHSYAELSGIQEEVFWNLKTSSRSIL